MLAESTSTDLTSHPIFFGWLRTTSSVTGNTAAASNCKLMFIASLGRPLSPLPHGLVLLATADHAAAADAGVRRLGTLTPISSKMHAWHSQSATSIVHCSK